MSDVPGPPTPPEEPGAGDPTAPVEGRSGVETAVARTNAFTRRTLVAVMSALFLFGSCGVAYGVYQVAGAGSGGGPTLSPTTGTGSTGTSGSASPTPSPTGPGPDLVVASVSGTQVVIQNIGADAAGRFVVSVGSRAFIVETGLDPGAAATFDFPCRPGPLTAVADSTERVKEADEQNNARTAGPFDCASPSVSTTTSTTTKTQPPRLPDLIVRSVSADSVSVANIGRASAGAFTVSVGKAGSFRVGGLPAGGSATIGFSCTSGNLVATADPTNQVAESNESNNTEGAGPFTCLPDLIVSAIGRDSVTIANIGDGNAGPSHVAIAGQVFNVPSIPDGQKVTVDYQCVGGLIDVVADVRDEVQESNESNNTGSVDLGPC